MEFLDYVSFMTDGAAKIQIKENDDWKDVGVANFHHQGIESVSNADKAQEPSVSKWISEFKVMLAAETAKFHAEFQTAHTSAAMPGLIEATKADATFRELAATLPGANVILKCPVDSCVKTTYLWQVIMHLNDHHRWTREAIADHVDDLHDRGVINAEFQPWTKPEGATHADQDA